MSWKENAKKHPLDRNICICNKVTRRTVIETIQVNLISDMEGLRSATLASTGCGACYGSVEALLHKTLAGDD